MVERYNISGFHTLVNTNNGYLVKFSDYEALEAKLLELEQEIKDRAYSEKCVTKILHDALDERDDLQAKLAALVEHVKYYQMILETTPGKWAAGLSENMKQAIAAAEGR